MKAHEEVEVQVEVEVLLKVGVKSRIKQIILSISKNTGVQASLFSHHDPPGPPLLSLLSADA